MNKRPNSYDPKIITAAVREILPDVVRWLADDRVSQHDLLNDLVRVLSGSCDGYRAAKKMEDVGYEPDAELVEILDAYSTYSALRDAERRWVAENNIAAVFAVGTVVKARWGGRPIVGPICEIHSETAHYIVQHDPAQNGGAVVCFEDVEGVLSEAS